MPYVKKNEESERIHSTSYVLEKVETLARGDGVSRNQSITDENESRSLAVPVLVPVQAGQSAVSLLTGDAHMRICVDYP